MPCSRGDGPDDMDDVVIVVLLGDEILVPVTLAATRKSASYTAFRLRNMPDVDYHQLRLGEHGAR